MGKFYANKRKPKREGKKLTVGKVEAVPAGTRRDREIKRRHRSRAFQREREISRHRKFLPAQRLSSGRFAAFTAASSNAIFTAGGSTCGRGECFTAPSC